MAIDIRVPTLGESVTEATVGQWYKKAGDAVAVDEPLCELETDKVTVEVPAPAAGVLASISVNEGDTVAVGAVLASLAEGEGAAAGAAPASSRDGAGDAGQQGQGATRSAPAQGGACADGRDAAFARRAEDPGRKRD